MTKKITEKRLIWYGHVNRRDEGQVLRRMSDAPVPEKRRGSQNIRWKDYRKTDMESEGLKEEDVLGRTKWNNDYSIPFRLPQMMGKACVG